MSELCHPMLAADLAKLDNDFALLKYPLLASPKLDGIRALLHQGVAYSRNLKTIRNRSVQVWASSYDLHGLDGEFIVGEPTAPDCYNVTQSAIMSAEGQPDFTFYAFDRWAMPDATFAKRLDSIARAHLRVIRVEHKLIRDAVELADYEAEQLALGYEGVMLRQPNGPYKAGRSTLKEGWLIKVKRFMDGEARVLRIEAAETNTNEAFKDELGRTKRSTAKAGRVAKEMIGTIVVRCPVWGELRLSPGTMPHEQRAFYWHHPDHILGRTVHYRAFGYGVKDLPRFPRFYGFRGDL